MKKKYIIKKARKLLVEQINSHQTIVRNDMNNIETMSNMKGLSEVIPKDNDGYCTIAYMIDLECKKKEGFCGKSFNSGF